MRGEEQVIPLDRCWVDPWAGVAPGHYTEEDTASSKNQNPAH